MLMGARTVTKWSEHLCSLHKALVSTIIMGEIVNGLQREMCNSTCFKDMGSEILMAFNITEISGIFLSWAASLFSLRSEGTVILS